MLLNCTILSILLSRCAINVYFKTKQKHFLQPHTHVHWWYKVMLFTCFHLHLAGRGLPIQEWTWAPSGTTARLVERSWTAPPSLQTCTKGSKDMLRSFHSTDEGIMDIPGMQQIVCYWLCMAIVQSCTKGLAGLTGWHWHVTCQPHCMQTVTFSSAAFNIHHSLLAYYTS